MLILDCPCCGVRADETELAPGGEAHIYSVGADSDDAAIEAYLLQRKKPKGGPAKGKPADRPFHNPFSDILGKR